MKGMVRGNGKRLWYIKGMVRGNERRCGIIKMNKGSDKKEGWAGDGVCVSEDNSEGGSESAGRRAPRCHE